MMKKYNWGLRKAMEFLTSRRPDINLKPAFLQQLAQYERRLLLSGRKFTMDWTELPQAEEELLLRNTYINSHIAQAATDAPAGESALG